MTSGTGTTETEVGKKNIDAKQATDTKQKTTELEQKNDVKQTADAKQTTDAKQTADTKQKNIDTKQPIQYKRCTDAKTRDELIQFDNDNFKTFQLIRAAWAKAVDEKKKYKEGCRTYLEEINIYKKIITSVQQPKKTSSKRKSKASSRSDDSDDDNSMSNKKAKQEISDDKKLKNDRVFKIKIKPQHTLIKSDDKCGASNEFKSDKDGKDTIVSETKSSANTRTNKQIIVKTKPSKNLKMSDNFAISQKEKLKDTGINVNLGPRKIYRPTLFKIPIINVIIYVKSMKPNFSGAILGSSSKFVITNNIMLSSYWGLVFINSASPEQKFNSFSECVEKCRTLFSFSDQVKEELNSIKEDDLIFVDNYSIVSSNRAIHTLGKLIDHKTEFQDLTSRDVEKCDREISELKRQSSDIKYDKDTIVSVATDLFHSSVADFTRLATNSN